LNNIFEASILLPSDDLQLLMIFRTSDEMCFMVICASDEVLLMTSALQEHLSSDASSFLLFDSIAL